MFHSCDICCVGIIYFGIILDYVVIFTGCIFFGKVQFTAVIMPNNF
jgi:hypothetical protein